jgi:hypothetical protein
VAYGDSDRAYLLGEDFGITVVYSGTTVVGQLDEVTEDMLAGHVVPQLGVTRTVLVATGSISPVAGQSITVDGTIYTVYEVRREAIDGRLTRVWLAS